MKIPIQNIYYLLCYAWDKLEEDKKTKVNISDYDSLLDLFTRLLINGCTQLFKRGLDRQYVEFSDDIAGIKGKLNISDSISRSLFQNGKASCSFDEFDFNVLHNQILKSTLFKLINIKNIPVKLRKEMKSLYVKFNNVDLIDLKNSDFNKVRLNRNNLYYDFLLKICEFINKNTVLNEQESELEFIDFVRDGQMNMLFEQFLRNFYAREFKNLKVKRDRLKWKFTPINDSNINLVPSMETDISIESLETKWIIDAKFYKSVTSNYHNKEMFSSNNLYQMYSYIKQAEDETDIRTLKTKGILLYPTTSKNFDQSYQIENHTISVKTVNLADKWYNIDKRLRQIINE